MCIIRVIFPPSQSPLQHKQVALWHDSCFADAWSSSALLKESSQSLQFIVTFTHIRSTYDPQSEVTKHFSYFRPTADGIPDVRVLIADSTKATHHCSVAHPFVAVPYAWGHRCSQVKTMTYFTLVRTGRFNEDVRGILNLGSSQTVLPIYFVHIIRVWICEGFSQRFFVIETGSVTFTITQLTLHNPISSYTLVAVLI